MVYPTGIILQPEAGLYRSSGGSASAEPQYHLLAEPQLDENGEETWEPIFHAERVSN